MTQYLKGIASIIEKYQFFLIDMSGVIHDGITDYPDAIDTLHALKKEGKNIIFFSNTPRPQSATKQKLTELGYDTTDELIITAGDVFMSELQQELKINTQKPLAYPLGIEQNRDLDLSQIFDLTHEIDKAQILVLLAFLENTSEFDSYDELLSYAARQKLVAFCPNPDTIVYHGEQLRYPAGYLASKYELLGGEVRYYGKPYQAMYEYAFKGRSIDKSKVLAIGDNLCTDILGAQNFGVDSILISKGIYKNITNINLLIEGYKIYPTYILQHLKY